MTSIGIRPANHTDLPEVVALWAVATDQSAALNPRFRRSDDSESHFMAFLAAQLDNDDAVVVVAADSALVAGYCVALCQLHPPLVVQRRYGVVYDIAVDAAMRGHGIGSRLYAYVEQWFAQRKIDHIELNVLIANRVARAFWQRCGFEPYVELLAKHIPAAHPSCSTHIS